MGGVNLVIHAIVVVTIGLVTSRMLLLSTCCYHVILVINCKIKMNCKLAFKFYYLIANETCFVLNVSPELTPLK